MYFTPRGGSIALGQEERNYHAHVQVKVMLVVVVLHWQYLVLAKMVSSRNSSEVWHNCMCNLYVIYTVLTCEEQQLSRLCSFYSLNRFSWVALRSVHWFNIGDTCIALQEAESVKPCLGSQCIRTQDSSWDQHYHTCIVPLQSPTTRLLHTLLICPRRNIPWFIHFLSLEFYGRCLNLK